MPCEWRCSAKVSSPTHTLIFILKIGVCSKFLCSIDLPVYHQYESYILWVLLFRSVLLFFFFLSHFCLFCWLVHLSSSFRVHDSIYMSLSPVTFHPLAPWMSCSSTWRRKNAIPFSLFYLSSLLRKRMTRDRSFKVDREWMKFSPLNGGCHENRFTPGHGNFLLLPLLLFS